MNLDCTIVIPYHAASETVDFIKRQLKFYASSLNPSMVLLALSGDKSIKKELILFLKEFDKKRFKIFSVEEVDICNVHSWVKKIFNALELVTTPYVAINGADDVIIPEALKEGAKILEAHPEVAGVKGHTIYFNCNSGKIFFSRDLEISNKSSMERLKLAIKDRDSIFYIIRRTVSLRSEFESINTLAFNTSVIGNSLYHVEHLMAMCTSSLGKILVFNSLWRLQSSHDYNHTSHTPAAFLRIKLGVLDRQNYDWFRSRVSSLSILTYSRYKFLWTMHQIRGISVSIRQLCYHYVNRNCTLNDFLRVTLYYFLNKIYLFSEKCLPRNFFPERAELYGNGKEFMKMDVYCLLKKYYFSEENIKRIESAASQDQSDRICRKK